MTEKENIFNEIIKILMKYQIKDTDEMIKKLNELCDETQKAGKINLK